MLVELVLQDVETLQEVMLVEETEIMLIVVTEETVEIAEIVVTVVTIQRTTSMVMVAVTGVDGEHGAVMVPSFLPLVS
jgi:hypothetical protein